jgi:hypothetical protein
MQVAAVLAAIPLNMLAGRSVKRLWTNLYLRGFIASNDTHHQLARSPMHVGVFSHSVICYTGGLCVEESCRS